MKKFHLCILILFALLCGGCSAVKKLTPPEVSLPSAESGYFDTDSLTIADLGWWEFYGDEYLKDIIQKVLENNKRLQMAAQRVEQSRYLLNADKAKLLPELSFRLPWNHETNSYYQELKLIDPEIGVKATISWEADLFGSLRWNKKKSQAQYLATVQDERAMRMVLVAETASAYFRLVALDNELSIVRSTMTTREEGVRLAKLRFEGGLTSETVYQQAQVQYATAAALIPNLEYNIKVAENALLILMGELPDREVLRARELKDNSLPERIPAGLPSSLLERRPDIVSFEEKLRSAVANVGYTYAKRFPSLNIELTGGLEDNDFKNLFRSPFSYVAENFVAPLVDFGKRKNTYKAAVAAYEEARLGYENKVLEAFQEVDNAATRYSTSRMAVTRDTELLEAAYKYQDLTWKQYRGGTINYIDVLDAQRRYLEARISRINAIRDEHLALVQLYKALGGGWTLAPSGDEASR
ncbi:MAG: TolC family protein [Muribaculaceae bacterium]|nr:TolC family protein [Muribaculaceae bacterium]